MQLETQASLNKDTKMANYLKDNSFWYKELNRNSQNYKKFTNFIKEKYKLKTSDRITGLIDDIEIVNSVLNVIKD